MKNVLRYTLALIFLLTIHHLNAQNTSNSLVAKTQISEETVVTAKSLKPTDAIEEARRRFKMLFNIYRDFSITIDTLALAKEEIQSKTPEEKANQDFGAYLVKMTNILTKKADKIAPNSIANRTERSHYLAGLNTLKSAKCLQSNNQEKAFVKTRDMDNNVLMAFELDGIRHSNRYGRVENYREGFARIQKDQVYGFLNLCGDEVITCQYERAEPFNLGKALVKRVDWFFVDGDGNETDALENVVEAKPLKQGVSWARMSNEKQALIDNNYATTKVALSQYYDAVDTFFNKDVVRVRNGKKLGLIGLDGKTIFDAIYDNVEATNLPHVFRLFQNKNVGLLDTSWAIRTSPIHESISDFNEFGIAVIKDKRGSSFVNVKDFKTSKFYTYVSDYNEFGVSTVRNEANLYGLIDTNLNVVVQPKYASIGVFNQLGLAPACHPDGKCGFIKYDGKEQIKANYESVSNFNAFGLAVAKTLVEGCNGGNSACKADVIIDRNGNTVVPVTDDGIRRKFQYQLTDSLRDGRYIVVKVMENDVSLAASYLLINKNDLQLITGIPYQTITANDAHGNFRVEDKGKWGILDSTGRVVTKLIYQEIKRVNDDYYATKNDKGKWGYLNKKGKPQIPFDYEEVRNYRFGLAPVSQGRGKWGLINRFNAKIVPCVFKSVVLNAAETKFEVTDENNVVFIINERGECETNCAKLDELRAKANRN